MLRITNKILPLSIIYLLYKKKFYNNISKYYIKELFSVIGVVSL